MRPRLAIAVAVAVAVAVILLSGCAPEIVIPKPDPPPPPPPATQIRANFEAGADLNPDSRGQPAPVLIRVYQLRADTGLKGADFFDVFKSDKAALAADLVHKDEFVMRPGDTRELAFEPKPDAQLIGLFAAFRAVDSAQWRTMAPIAAHKINKYSIVIGKNRIELTALPPETPPPPAPPPEAKAEGEPEKK